jgi:O-antigen/teichoic acid export membrane protein
MKSEASTKADLRKFWQYGAPLTLWFFVMGLLSVGDRYMIAYFGDNAEVGIYSVNYNLVTQALALINSPFMIAIFPIITYQWAQGLGIEVRETLANMTDIYIQIGVAMIGGIAVVGRPLTELIFGPEFHDGYVVLLPVAIGLVIYGTAVVGQKSIEMVERTDLMLRVAIVAAAANLLLNFLLIPRFGYIAAAYTTLFSYLIYAASVWLIARRFLPWTISLNKAALSIACGAVAVVTANLSLQYVNLSASLWRILVGGSLFFLVYAIALLISRFSDYQVYWRAARASSSRQ